MGTDRKKKLLNGSSERVQYSGVEYNTGVRGNSIVQEYNTVQ